MAGISAAALLLASATTSSAETPSAQRAAMQAFMRQKLVLSQSLLEGLSLERYDQVQKSAVQLRKMSQTNSWSTLGNVQYRAQMTNYQANLDALWAAAGDRSLDAAASAYAKVVVNCVDCHRIVRVDQHLRQVNREGK
ncbi:MAG: hypothetical protein U1G08_12585 [Verrucomicrobiota bacterium]